jgi:hypothetical protein
MSDYNTSAERHCTSSDTKERPFFIHSDKAMSEEEEKRSIYGLHEIWIPPSIFTKEVETHAALTEFRLFITPTSSRSRKITQTLNNTL